MRIVFVRWEKIEMGCCIKVGMGDMLRWREELGE